MAQSLQKALDYSKKWLEIIQQKEVNEEEGKWITLKVSAAGLRNINKKGLYACIKEAREKGFLDK